MKLLFLILFSLIIYSQCQQYLYPIIIDDFTVPGEISVKGRSGASVQTNLADNNTHILGLQRILYTNLQGVTSGSNLDTSEMKVVLPTVSDQFGSVNLGTNISRTAFGMIFWDGLNNVAGNPCGIPSYHLNNPQCAQGCPTFAGNDGIMRDVSNKDGLAFLLIGLEPASSVNFLVSVWGPNGGYAYAAYSYPGGVSNTAPTRPEFFFPFQSLTVVAPVDYTNVLAFAIEMNTTGSGTNVSISAPQLMGVTVLKTSNLSNTINPGNSVATVGPNTGVTFFLYILPDIFQLRQPINATISPINYSVTVIDTLPSQFTSFSAGAPFTSSLVTLDNSLITNDLTQLATNVQTLPKTLTTPTSFSTSGQVGSASYNFGNPQGVSLSFESKTASSFNFCRQVVCNTANFNVTTFGVTGTSVRQSSTSYCVTLQGTPSLTTQFTNCPSTFVNKPSTNVSVCNVGSGQATSVSFSQGIYSGCSATAVTPGVTCAGGACTANLGALNPTQCTNVVINFDCTTAGTGVNNITFTSQVTATESCVGSSSQSSCSFVYVPVLIPNLVPTLTCPPSYTTNPITNGKICNTGNGTANSVFYNQTALSGCSVISTSLGAVTCNGGFCTGNVGNLAPNQCVNVSITFDCSSFANSCTNVNFPSTLTGSDSLPGSSVTTQPCSFSLTPGTTSLNSQFTTCPSASTLTPQTVAQICNGGTGTARNVFFNQTVLNGCSATPVTPGITCAGGVCTGNLGNLNSAQCASVTINFDCSASYSTSCTTVTLPTSISGSETCGSKTTSNVCSPFYNPGTPSLTTQFTSCPSTYSTTPSTTIRTCNTGTGTARNTFFNQTIYSGCSVPVTPPGITCSAGSCTGNLGAISAGQCVDITIGFNCASFANSCNVVNFASTTRSTESCVGATATSNCNFASNPSLTVTVSETLQNTVPARVGETITWNLLATNNGPATAQGYLLNLAYSQYTIPTAATLAAWNCNDVTKVCTYTGSSLTASSSNPIAFTVTLSTATPISINNVCNSVTMTTTPNSPNCQTTSSTSSCANVTIGVPDIALTKSVVTSQYTFTITYNSIGTGAVNSLVLSETLQPGWSLSSTSASLGWSCVGSQCNITVPNVPTGTTGKVDFVVDVDPMSQSSGNSLTCWRNTVSTSFTDQQFDLTPQNNQASASIGSYCTSCCKQEPCPTNDCTIVCPKPVVTISNTCPDVQCKCVVPEFWCPPCQKEPPSCDCATCSNPANVVFGTNI